MYALKFRRCLVVVSTLLCALLFTGGTVAAQVLMTAPQPGQALNPGENVLIEWQVAPAAAPVNLAYSADDGQSWQIIALDQRGNSFGWTVPLDVEKAVLIRIARVAGAEPVPALEIEHERSEIRCLRFDAAGERLLASSGEGLVDIFDSDDGSLIATTIPLGPPSIVYQAQFVAGGPEIVFSRERDLFLWTDYSAAPQSLNITGHTDFIRSVDAHPTRRITVSADNAGRVILWDLESFEALRTYEAANDRIYEVRFSPDGRYIIYGGDLGRIYVRDWENEADSDAPVFSALGHGIVSERPDGTLDTNSRLIWSVDMNAAENYLVSAGVDRTVRRWNFGEQAVEASEVFRGHTLPIRSVAITLRGDRVISGGQDQSIRQWEPVGALELGPTLIHGSQVLSIDYNASRDLIASGGRSNLIKIWRSGYSAASADSVEISIGRREIALEIPAIESQARRRIDVPILLKNRDELDLTSPVRMRLTVESPRLLAEIDERRLGAVQFNYGLWNALIDTLEFDLEVNGLSDTLAVFPVLVLQGTPTVQPISFRSVEILSEEQIDIQQFDGSISIAGECGDDIMPREFVLTQAPRLQILSLAPNPAVRDLEIVWEQFNDNNITLTVLTAQGGIIRASAVEQSGEGQHRHSIQVDGLPPGSYFLCLEDGDIRDCEPFVVVR